MTHSEMMGLFDRVTERCREIMNGKGVDYSDGVDYLAHFKAVAEDTGLTVFQVWNVFMSKQIRTVQMAIKKDAEKVDLKGERVESRVTDMINYSVLLLGLVEDAEWEKDDEMEAEMGAEGEMGAWAGMLGGANGMNAERGCE